MVTAEEILDKNLYNKFDSVDRETFIRAMKEYAVLAIKEQLKKAAEEAVLYSDWDYYNGEKEVSIDGDRGSVIFEVDKDSIIDCPLIELK